MMNTVIENLEMMIDKKKIQISLSGNSTWIRLDRMSMEHVLLTLILYLMDQIKDNSSICINIYDFVDEGRNFLKISMISRELNSSLSTLSPVQSFKLCENIIEKHQGTLMIDRLEPQGLSVELLLPKLE